MTLDHPSYVIMLTPHLIRKHRLSCNRGSGAALSSVSTMSSIHYLRLEYEDPVLWDVQVDVLKRRISKLRKLSEFSRSCGIVAARRPSSCGSPAVSSAAAAEVPCHSRKLARRYGQSFQLDGEQVTEI